MSQQSEESDVLDLMDTDCDLDMASDFGRKEEEWREEKRKMEEKMKRMAQEMKRTVEEKRKAERERSKIESENRNFCNFIVRLEKRVESERKEKDNRKRCNENQCVGVANSYAFDCFEELCQDEENV